MSAMSDEDLARLAYTLDLVTHMHPKMHPDPTSPGVVRLDHCSGLFLDRGMVPGQWVLEARTCGHPAPQSVDEWHLLAAGAVHQLDRSVPLPRGLRLSAHGTRPASPAGSRTKRLARARRRLGLTN